jgi:hypothetical protein
LSDFGAICELACIIDIDARGAGVLPIPVWRAVIFPGRSAAGLSSTRSAQCSSRQTAADRPDAPPLVEEAPDLVDASEIRGLIETLSGMKRSEDAENRNESEDRSKSAAHKPLPSWTPATTMIFAV